MSPRNPENDPINRPITQDEIERIRQLGWLILSLKARFPSLPPDVQKRLRVVMGKTLDMHNRFGDELEEPVFWREYVDAIAELKTVIEKIDPDNKLLHEI